MYSDLVRLGEYNKTTEIDCDYTYNEDGDCNLPPQDLTIDRSFVHEKYDRNKTLYDIAVLRTKEPAKFTAFVQPICLTNMATHNKLAKPDVIVEAHGFGITSDKLGDLLPSDRKKKAAIEIIPDEECELMFEELIDLDSQFCAGGGANATCQGDSGGPVVVFNPADESWYQIVIVNWGVRCGQPGYGSVYVKVAHYLCWIQAHVF